MSNPSYASTIVQLAYGFAQELNRLYLKHKEVIDTNHFIPSNLKAGENIERRDVNLWNGIVTLRYEDVNEDWANKDENGQPTVKGLSFSVEAPIDDELFIFFRCSSSDTYETISDRLQRMLSFKIATFDKCIAKMKVMLGSLEVLD